MANPADIISQRDDAVAINGTINDQRRQSRAVSGDGLTSSDRLTSNTSTDAGDGSQMTVAQMLKIYAKDAVESALFEPDYTEARQREIDVLKAQIQQGINAVSCQEGLDLIEKTTPPGRPIDPQEPQDLHPDVLWRIQCLKYMYDNLDHSPEQSKNLKAILQEYRSKHLNVIKGHVTLFFAGIRKLGPIKEEEATPDFLMDKIKQWSAEHEGGQITVEQLLENHAKLLATTLSCFNISSHHMFTLLVRLEGQANFIEVPRVLDDTGSAYLELFESPDCFRLGYNEQYNGNMGKAELTTSNGKVFRPRFLVDVQLCISGETWGPVIRTIACMRPGSGRGQARCSGMFIRQHLFTATSPHGKGVLHISTHKSGVTRPLEATEQS